MSTINKAACVGGGVIGGAWVARFALAGIDVSEVIPGDEDGEAAERMAARPAVASEA